MPVAHDHRFIATDGEKAEPSAVFAVLTRIRKARSNRALRALSRHQLRDLGLEATGADPVYEVDARLMTALMAMR